MKRTAIIASIVCLFVFGAIGWNLIGRHLAWNGIARIAVERRSGEVPFDPEWLNRVLSNIKNAAQAEAFQSELSAAAKLPRDDFAFSEVTQPKNTLLIAITYATTDETAEERISTNAGMMLLRVVRTNQSVADIELIDCSAAPRPPFWSPWVDRVQRLLP